MDSIRFGFFVFFAFFSSVGLGAELRFTALVNGAPLHCNKEYRNVGVEKVNMTINDFKLYVSQFAVRDKHGNWSALDIIDDSIWQSNGVVLLDFENGQGSCISGTPQTNQVVRFKSFTSLDNIVSLKFEVGLPFHLNHIDPINATAPLNTTAMFWSWQNGYKFIKLDARFSETDRESKKVIRVGFPVHIGSTMCTSKSTTTAPSECKNPNRVHVVLEKFNINNDQIGIDIGTLLENSTVMKNTTGTAAGCMSFPGDPDCENIMRNLGLPYENSSSTQKVFKLMHK